MKQSIPAGVFIAIAAVVLVIAVGLVWRGSQGPPEFQSPKTTKTIPQYVWDKMTPSMRDQMKSKGYEPGNVAPSGQPGGPAGK